MTGAGSSAVQNQLTGLANRRSINDTLNNEWARASRHDRSLALVMLDVDFFKKYNESLSMDIRLVMQITC